MALVLKKHWILVVFVLLAFAVGTGGYPLQGLRTGLRVRSLPLKAKRSKEELNSLVESVGLNPVNKNSPVVPVPEEVSNSKNRKSAKKVPDNQNSQPKQNYRTNQSGRGGLSADARRVTVNVQLEYARNGSSVLRAFIDPELIRTIRDDLNAYSEKKELEAWRQKVEVGSNDPKLAKACRTIRDCKQQLNKLNIGIDNLPFLQYFNTWRDVASVKELCYALGHTASVLLDVPEVRLYQDALFSKRPADGPTPWHTDARMAPFDTANILTFWIPLQDIPKDGTALIFVPKSHNDFALPFWNEFDGHEYSRLERRYKDKTVHYMPMSVGDVTIHSGWTLHCADGNDSTECRHALAISIVDARAEIRETALDFSPSNGGGYGDNEDQWSYREWVSQVPVRKPFGTHQLVPIIWPVK
jgi:ectoine hydroxylase-related dioxygenase (phytanoyl-CoA dioxygenase family)